MAIKILKYQRIKTQRWRWESRHYDDLFSEIFDKLDSKKPDNLQENIQEALKRTAKCIPQKSVPVRLYTLSPNRHTKFTHKRRQK